MFHPNHVQILSEFVGFYFFYYKFSEQMVHSNRYGKNVAKKIAKRREKEEKRKIVIRSQ